MIAAVPSDQVVGAYPGPGYAWTLAGEPVPYGPIAVEKIAGPVLALGGRKDEVWDSAGAVTRIVDRARMYGRNDVVGVVYPRAGHGVLLGAELPVVGDRRGRARHLRGARRHARRQSEGAHRLVGAHPPLLSRLGQ